MLSREDLVEIAAIFGDAVDLAPETRTALLDARCGSRAAMRAEIDSLFAAHARADRMAPLAGDGHQAEPVAFDGAAVGAWRLRHKIGSGGMGDVYLAERSDGAFDGRAAIKFTRAYLPDMDAARRFRAERQFLASLNHPNIVTLLDGGTAASGQGYLVMEHVDGTPITGFCRDRRLSLAARLLLVRQVCAAVQYAHQRAIVHRDLKPSNILVTADGVPKILDFGVAKLVAGTAADGDLTSAAMPLPLTPNYASPEQLQGQPVTTACDVYSLGVLLYEVLTGARPYETTGKTLGAVIATVVDTEPLRPSHAPVDPGQPYPRAALRGDLDAIVFKAMRKEPAQRYRSAGELGDDLGRVLNREPVVARAPSVGYLLRRIADRHRAVVTVGAAAVVAISVAFGAAVWQRQVAVDAQQRADRRFREVRQLANALIFKIHDRVAALPGSTPVRREIVDEALGYLERLEQESAGDSALQLELAAAYRQISIILGDPQSPNLGDRPGARAQAIKARSLALPLADASQPAEEALSAMVEADRLLMRLEDDRADRLARSEEAVRYSQRAVDRSMPKGKGMLARAVFAYAGAVEPAAARIPHWQQAGRLFEDLLAERPDDPVNQRNVSLVARNLGGLLASLGRNDEAMKQYERMIALDERRLKAAPDNRLARLDASISYSQVAFAVGRAGDASRALAMHRKSLDLRQALAESDPKDVLTQRLLTAARLNVAIWEQATGNPRAALALIRLAVNWYEELHAKGNDPSSSADLGDALVTFGEIENSLGHHASACDRFRRSVELLTPPASQGFAASARTRAVAALANCKD